MNKVFSGLEQLGFKEIDVELYEKDIKKEIKKEATTNLYKSSLYEKKITCPVCDHTFKQLALKSNAYRMVSKDSDFFIKYDLVNPYFYDVYICESCGYSSLKVDFSKIGSKQKDLILKNITPKFRPKIYPTEYTREIAIERYKLALLNSAYLNSKCSTKAMICLKLAWMYRLGESNEDKELERNFLRFALEGFEEAFLNEMFPIYKMDKFLLMYLIGELNRRLLNYDEALSWFGRVLTTPKVGSTLKDLTRTQRDLIKEAQIIKTKMEQNGEALEEQFNFDNKDDTLCKTTTSESKNKVLEKNTTKPNKSGFFKKILGAI